MLPKIRLKPTPYDANISACTANDVVYGESPNQSAGRIARIAAVTTIGRSAQPTLPNATAPTRGWLVVCAIAPTVRAARGAG